jgi:peptidoglycan/LPS O-acetylase OafA/YrhL
MFPKYAGKVPSRLILLPALTYITVFVGLSNIPIPRFLKRGDYSYGIYLYHDPILQSVISIFPAICMTPRLGVIFTFACGFPFVFLMASFSWHFIEKPILALRRKFSFVAKTRLEETPLGLMQKATPERGNELLRTDVNPPLHTDVR